jgi:hypothetical protein
MVDTSDPVSSSSGKEWESTENLEARKSEQTLQAVVTVTAMVGKAMEVVSVGILGGGYVCRDALECEEVSSSWDSSSIEDRFNVTEEEEAMEWG